MKSTENIALHWGADGIETITDRKRARELYGAQHQMVWGADDKDESYKTGHDDNALLGYHPGRDYSWAGAKGEARREWAAIAPKIGLKSDLFIGRDSDVFNDLDILWSVAEGEQKRTGRDGAWLFDAAPNLYIAQETIKLTGEMVEEAYVDMSAKSLLPSVTLNTWLDVYRYDRKARKLNGVAAPVSLGGITERGVRKGGSYSRKPVYKPLEFFESGASWEFYELERHAEARQNGAPSIDIVREELELAKLQHELTYNFATLFSYPQTSVKGLIPTLVDLGRNVAAAQQLGAVGSTPEDDLAVFVDNFTEMIISSVRTERPDTIALGTAAWIYINTTDYKSVDAGMNETLAQAIMRHLGPLGLKDIIWVPEMDYRSEQATSWQDEIGLPAALAEDWAGGLNTENIMLMFARNPEVGRMVIGKPMAARPQQQVGERTTVLMLQSLGSYDIRREKAYRLVTDIGPA